MLDNPRVLRKISGTMIILSLVEWVIAGLTGWVKDVTYLSHLSQFTFTVSLVPWHQGNRIEDRQVKDEASE